MKTRHSWDSRRKYGAPYGWNALLEDKSFERDLSLGPFLRTLALIFLTLFVCISTIVMAIIGIVFVAGGFDPPYIEQRYPKPDGYKLHIWRIEGRQTLCVDPRDGPSVDWTLLDLSKDAVATLRAASPSLPLEVTGICRSAGGDADSDGKISWERMDGLWGLARGTNIALNPDIAPASWSCVRNVMLHELGHLAGLNHQSEDLPSMMNPGGCQHDITLIDIAALQHLYEGRSRP